MTEDQHTHVDPRTKYPQPEYPEQSQIEQHPGDEAAMNPKPDYGYDTYRGSGKLTGKRAVITGGDSGIGRAVALAYAREGADIVISYLPDEESDADETVRIVEEAGRKCIKIPGDISDEEQCKRVVQTAVDELGHIDVLVNNAAHQMTVEGVMDVSSELLDRTFKTNIYAMFWLCQAALPHMPEGGSFINTSSIQAYQPSPVLLPYSATKGAIISFTKGLALEVAEYGLRANIVAPGPVWTPIIPASMPGETVSQFGGTSPMGRPAQPAELAPAYVFLASQEASFVNGETLGVTGGKPIP